jgi:hypothetical protein
MVDLEKQVAFLTKVVKSVEESHHILARTALTTNQRVDLAETEQKKLTTQFKIFSHNTHNKGKKSS